MSPCRSLCYCGLMLWFVGSVNFGCSSLPSSQEDPRRQQRRGPGGQDAASEEDPRRQRRGPGQDATRVRYYTTLHFSSAGAFVFSAGSRCWSFHVESSPAAVLCLISAGVFLLRCVVWCVVCHPAWRVVCHIYVCVVVY